MLFGKEIHREIGKLFQKWNVKLYIKVNYTVLIKAKLKAIRTSRQTRISKDTTGDNECQLESVAGHSGQTSSTSHTRGMSENNKIY